MIVWSIVREQQIKSVAKQKTTILSRPVTIPFTSFAQLPTKVKIKKVW